MTLLLYISLLLFVLLVFGQKEECDKGGGFHTNGIGTVLFTAADEFKQCWSPDEIAMLTSRLIMEDLLPDVSVINIDSNTYTDDLVAYFRLLIEVVKKSTHGRKKRISLLVLTDIIGGYLQYAVLPIARRAFYSGLIDYTSIEKLIQLYEEVKWFLRTNGQGWSRPMNKTPEFEVQVIDFDIEAPKSKNCCNQLIYYEYEHHFKPENSNKSSIRMDIAYPMPFFDSNVKPTSIAVPFKRYALRNIESRRGSYFLFKFFVTAWQCFVEKSSSKDAKLKFQNSFFAWLQSNVIPKLKDDKFYSAFGGILRVWETLKSLGAVPYVESTCPPIGDEEMSVPDSESHRSRTSTIVLIVMLIIIFIWFIIGTTFICLRMKKKKDNKDPAMSNDSYTKSSKSVDSIGVCKCSIKSDYSSSLTSEFETDNKSKKKTKDKSEKSVTICYPPFMSPYLEDKPTTLIDSSHTNLSSIKPKHRKKFKGNETGVPCKHFPGTSGTSTSRRTSMENIMKKIKPGLNVDECWCDILQEEDAEIDDIAAMIEDKSGYNRVNYTTTLDESNMIDSRKGNVTLPSQSTAENSPLSPRTFQESTDETSAQTDKDRTTHAFACHSSLTGAYAREKTTPGKPYIFGYDFQSSTSSDLSDVDADDTDVKTPTSK